MATLLEALNRHRGKGQRKVTVEHVDVHAGEQAIVGNVEQRGGAVRPKSKDQPDVPADRTARWQPHRAPPVRFGYSAPVALLVTNPGDVVDEQALFDFLLFEECLYRVADVEDAKRFRVGAEHRHVLK